mgnify:FL=1
MIGLLADRKFITSYFIQAPIRFFISIVRFALARLKLIISLKLKVMSYESLRLESRVFVAIFSTNPYPLAAAAISIVAALLALLVIMSSRHYKEPLGKMIFWLLLGDLFFYLPKVVLGFPYEKSDFICSLGIIPSKFGMSMAFFWSTAFAHAFYSAIRHDDAGVIHKNMKYYVIINTTLSISQAVAAGLTDFIQFDEDSKGCVHFLNEGAIDYLMIFLGQLPLGGVCLLSIIWYLLGLWLLRKRFPFANRRDLLSILLYPTILLVCWLPVMGLSLSTSFGVVFEKNILIYAEILGNLQGFFDALAYGGTNDKMKKAIRKFGKRCCKKRGRRPKRESFDEAFPDITIKRTALTKQPNTPSLSANLSTHGLL